MPNPEYVAVPNSTKDQLAQRLWLRPLTCAAAVSRGAETAHSAQGMNMFKIYKSTPAQPSWQEFNVRLVDHQTASC